MARDATARLYDVHPGSVVLKKRDEQKKYDHGTITFRARKGKLIDLDKLHESIWATRLSGGTRSGLVSLEVTAVGEVVVDGKNIIIRVAGSKSHFLLGKDPVLGKNPVEGHEDELDKLRAAVKAARKVVSVTGRLDGWKGRWPQVLRKLPSKPRRILVTSFKTVKERESAKRPERKNR